MTEKRYMDIKSLSEYIPLTVSTIYSMVSRKEIPFNKPTKKLIFDRIEIDEWMKKGKTEPNNVSTPKFKI